MRAFVQHRQENSDKMVLQALVPFRVLMDYALFTCKANPNEYIAEDYKRLAEENLDYYQRRINADRLKDIQKFIINAILEEKNDVSLATLFPSSMIIAMQMDELPKGDEEMDIAFENNIFIVDGQHRLMAMILLYKRLKSDDAEKSENAEYIVQYLERYKFNCTILVNFDLWEQGQVFINVNFKQKPVNRSLYYEVFGSEYREGSPDDKRNQIYIAHCLVKDLNEKKQSPFYHRIKMLGTGAGYVSQAFFVESIIPLFKVNGIWWKNPLNYEISDGEYNAYLTELISYLNAVKDTFSDYWPKPQDRKGTIVCKTTGVGAFIRLLSYIRNSSEDDFLFNMKSTPQGEICQDYYHRMMELLAPIKESAEKLFGENSDFASGSGKGFEVRMFKAMKVILKQINSVKILKDSIEVTTSLSKRNISIDDVVVMLRSYYWTNVDDELSSISHHYEFDDMEDIELHSVEEKDGKLFCEMTFEGCVTLYLANDDDRGFDQIFPATVRFALEDDGGNWELDEESVETRFDTSEF